jgi:hypothetical protein
MVFLLQTIMAHLRQEESSPALRLFSCPDGDLQGFEESCIFAKKLFWCVEWK